MNTELGNNAILSAVPAANMEHPVGLCLHAESNQFQHLL
jgi:hypothetical protein